uniref:TGF-beta family profile domain-containing protein n=1 Tax=Sinocyclocheilus anshuiensis TaxID=1608454 RepID=A0A671NMF1_9TELE
MCQTTPMQVRVPTRIAILAQTVFYMIATLVDRKERRIRAETGRRTKRARKGPKPCSLHEIELTVSELGLGYESDETVRFRYCSGKCIHERRNYDIKGRRGRDNGKKDKARYAPCCRPTKFEKKMSFFDNKDKFYTIQNVSARACGCV